MTLSLLLFVPDAFAGGGMSLVPDLTLTVLQMLPFLATMFVLNALVFKPMVAYLEDRDKATVGAQAEAADLTQKAESKLAVYEEQLSSARADIQAMRAKLRGQAKDEREAALASARVDCEARLSAAVSEIQAEGDVARKELAQNTASLADAITSAVLGRDASA
jgi:F-type H+-transporting ATPase subunit b